LREPKSVRERYILVAATDEVIKAGEENICVAEGHEKANTRVNGKDGLTMLNGADILNRTDFDQYTPMNRRERTLPSKFNKMNTCVRWE